MFLRLLLAFVAFGVLTAGLVGVVLLHRDRTGGFAEAILIILIAGLIAIGPAWVFARSFVRPFREIQDGAGRIARGEYGHRVHGGAWRESRELARGFNEMSARLAEQIDRLEAERQQLRAILGGMAEGVVAVGAGQRLLFANEAAGRMLEFDPAGAIGRPLYEVSRQPAVQGLIERARKTGQPQREQMEFKKPVPRHVTIFVAPLAADGSPGAVLVLTDTSETRRLDRLRQELAA